MIKPADETFLRKVLSDAGAVRPIGYSPPQHSVMIILGTDIYSFDMGQMLISAPSTGEIILLDWLT